MGFTIAPRIAFAALAVMNVISYKFPVMENLGAELQRIRCEADKSQAAVAKLARCSRDTVSKLELSKRNVSLATLRGIAAALRHHVQIEFIPFADDEDREAVG